MIIRNIYGEEGVGKSTVCLKFLKCLLALNAKVNTYNTFEWGDFKAMLTLADTRIAIYSAGDEKGHLMDAIDFGREVCCDYLICCERKNIHWREVIEGLNENELHNCITLENAIDPNEREIKQNELVVNLLNLILNKAENED